MLKGSKKNSLDPAIKDVWNSTFVIRLTKGLSLGIFQYTYYVFLYDHFGGNEKALNSIVFLIILTSVMILLTEVPTGALGDHIGRKKTVVLSFVFLTVSNFLRTWIFFISSFSYSFTLAFLSVVFYAMSYTLFNGCFTAWLVDTIRERNIQEGHGRILAKSYGGMMLAKIGGGVISISLYLTGYVYYAFGIGCIASLLCTVYCGISMKECSSLQFHNGKFVLKESFTKMKEIITNGFKISIRTPQIACMALMYSGFMLVITVVNYLWPVAMKSNFGIGKMSPYWFVLVFTSMTAAFIGAKLLEKINHYCVDGEPKKLPDHILWNWFAVVCLVMSLPIIILGVCTSRGIINLPLFITVLAIFNIGYGFLMPAYEILINYYIPANNSKERATIMSFAGMLLEVVSIVLIFPSSGPNGKETAVGWILPASLLVVLTVVVSFLMRRYNAKNNVLEPSAVLVEN